MATRRETPPDFVEIFGQMNVRQVAKHYRMDTNTVKRISHELGINRPIGVVLSRPKPLPAPVRSDIMRSSVRALNPHIANRASGLADRAVDECLRKLGPVYRCNAEKRPTQGGKFWLCWSRLKTDAEVVEMAERRGWEADAWKRVPARLAGAVA